MIDGIEAMRISRIPLSSGQAKRAAEMIVTLPEGDIPALVQEMMYKRDLFRTVSALDDLIAENGEHRAIAVRALTKLRLWCGG
jgi:hypothetical protein